MPVRDMVRVRPAAAQRQAFARWAVAQSPKIRTVNSFEFAVPPELFTVAPEEVLIGALVDGHRYVPCADAAPPPGGDLLGVARPEALTPPLPPAGERGAGGAPGGRHDAGVGVGGA